MPDDITEKLALAVEELSKRESVRTIVVGDFMLDRYIWGSCGRISPESPVPVVEIKSETDCLGGAGNVVANIRGLGAASLPVGVVGADEAGQRVLQHLEELGCSTEGLFQLDEQTTQKTRVIAQNKQVVRIDRETAEGFSSEVYERLGDHVRKALDNVDVCILSDYGKGVGQSGFVKRLVLLAKSKSVPLLVDPHGIDFSHYGGASCITPNVAETSRVISLGSTDDDAIAAAARTLSESYEIASVLITRGADGMTLSAEDTVTHIPSEAREVYDVSGAGDAVIATMAVGIASGLSHLDAAQLSNVAAGIVVGKVGTAPISLAELQGSLHARTSEFPHSKVLSEEQLERLLGIWRTLEKKVVFANGCFDVLHAGHVTLLEEAAKLGDVLIVAINSDQSVRRLKDEGRPINDQSHRALVLAGLRATDAVVIFREDTPEGLLRKVKPDVLVKGDEYGKNKVVGGSFVDSYGGEVVRVRMVEGYSTTRAIEKLRGLEGGHSSAK